MKTTKFKPSEVGPIPVEWEVKRLEVLADIQLGKMVDEEKNVGILKRYLSNRDVHWGRIDVSDLHQVRMTSDDLHKYDLREGDLLVCEGGEVGRAAIWHAPIHDCYFQKTLHRVRVKACNDLHVSYLQNLLRRYADVGMFDAYVAKTSIAHLPKDKFERLPILCPPPTEQEKIAEALSDVDALLVAITTLIEKKRSIKQGAMQQLLTGKKRLAGFAGKWVEKRLGEVCEMNPPGEGIPEKFVYVDLESVVGGSLLARKIVERTSAPSRAQRRFKRGDILFQTVRPYQKNNLYVDFEAERFVASTGYAVLRGLPGVGCSSFVYHMLHTDSFTDAVLDRCTGTSYPAINPGKLAEIVLRLPQEFAEQKAIAAVLSDMDAEIAALEVKRAKYESVKQGMMQELLTGRVRLVGRPDGAGLRNTGD